MHTSSVQFRVIRAIKNFVSDALQFNIISMHFVLPWSTAKSLPSILYHHLSRRFCSVNTICRYHFYSVCCCTVLNPINLYMEILQFVSVGLESNKTFRGRKNGQRHICMIICFWNTDGNPEQQKHYHHLVQNIFRTNQNQWNKSVITLFRIFKSSFIHSNLNNKALWTENGLSTTSPPSPNDIWLSSLLFWVRSSHIAFWIVLNSFIQLRDNLTSIESVNQM